MATAPIPASVPHFGDLTSWAINTFYALGQRVENGGEIYVVVTQGTSAGAGPGPAGMGAGIVDNTVVWDWVVTAAPAWVTLTPYTAGDVVTNGGNLYQAQTTGISGAAPGPTGTGGAIVDGTVTWSYIGALVAQTTTPTSRRGDQGFIPGSAFFSGYVNWFFTSIIAWLYMLRDLVTLAWTWTAAHTWSQAVVTWTLVQTFDDTLGAGNEQTRIYRGLNGALFLTQNAYWTEALAPAGWKQDVSAISIAVNLGTTTTAGFASFYQIGMVGAAWTDAQWLNGYYSAKEFISYCNLATMGSTAQDLVRSVWDTAGAQLSQTYVGTAQTPADVVTIRIPITIATVANSVMHIRTTITAIDAGITAGLRYVTFAGFLNSGGVLSQLGAGEEVIGVGADGIGGGTTHAWVMNAPNVEFQITGSAGTIIDWTVSAEVDYVL